MLTEYYIVSVEKSGGAYFHYFRRIKKNKLGFIIVAPSFNRILVPSECENFLRNYYNTKNKNIKYYIQII